MENNKNRTVAGTDVNEVKRQNAQANGGAKRIFWCKCFTN